MVYIIREYTGTLLFLLRNPSEAHMEEYPSRESEWNLSFCFGLTDISVKNSLHLLRIPILVLGGQIFEMLRNISAWTSPNSTATYLLFTSWKSLPLSGYQSQSLSAFQALEIPRLNSFRGKKDISATGAFDLSVVLQVV